MNRVLWLVCILLLSFLGLGKAYERSTPHSSRSGSQGHIWRPATASDGTFRAQTPDSYEHRNHIGHLIPEINDDIASEWYHSNEAPSASIEPSSDMSASNTRESLSNTIDFSINALTTNASFEEQVCGGQGGGVDESTESIAIYSSANFYIELPSCVYDLPFLSSLYATKVIISGNASRTDPLMRLPDGLVTLQLDLVRFVVITGSGDASTADYAPNWSAILSQFSALNDLTITSSGLSGSLPISFNSMMQAIRLNGNALSGTIPDNWLEPLTSSAFSFLEVDISNNQLSGSIPNNVFHFATPRTLSIFSFAAASNSLSGVLSSGLFSSMNMINDTLSGRDAFWKFDVSSNAIGGSIPLNFLGPTLANARSVRLCLTSNPIEGSISADLISSMENLYATQIDISLSSTNISGVVPADLLIVPNNHYRNIILDFSYCKLTGQLPLLLNTEFSALEAITFIARNNSLTGSLPRLLYASGASSQSLARVILAHNSLTSLSSDLFQDTRINTLEINLDDNKMTGNPFFPFQNADSGLITTLVLSANRNAFSGPIPTQPFAAYTSNITIPSTLSLSLNENKLSGPIPNNFFGGYASSASLSLTLSLVSNSLSSSIPMSLFDTTSGAGFRSVSLNVSMNQLDGSLPTNLFPTSPSASLETYILSARSNKLTGPINAGMLSAMPNTVRYLTLEFDNNPLSATLPALLDFNSQTRIMKSILSFKNCSLYGNSLPKINTNRSVITELLLDNNLLSGSLILSDLITDTLSEFYKIVTLSLRNNRLTGALSITSIIETPARYAVNIYASNNNLTQLTWGSSASSFLNTLDVRNNSRLSGTLPTALFASTSSLTTLLASRTSLSGSMPTASGGPPALETLDLSFTNIDFCSPSDRPLLTITRMTSCGLNSTSASDCVGKYPAICSVSSPMPSPFIPPLSTPPPAAPICQNKTRPSLLFECINGIWVANTVTSPTLNIPSGAATTIVNGSISSEFIIFDGAGTTLVVNGCANNLTAVTLRLSPEELKKMGKTSIQTLITYNGNDTECSDLSGVQVQIKATGSSCRRVESRKTSNTSQLSAILTIDSSNCKTWWIILVSVVCGVIVILAIVAVLLVLFVPSVRHFVRPYSRRRAASKQSI